MIKEMKSVFDTHNYYEKALNPPPPPPPPQEIKKEIVDPSPLPLPPPKIVYIYQNWIVRGVPNKFDWVKFRDESAKLDVIIGSVIENIEKLSKQKVWTVSLKGLH